MLTLTMWDAFVENECNTIENTIHRKQIVAGLRVRVVSHNGKYVFLFNYTSLKIVMHTNCYHFHKLRATSMCKQNLLLDPQFESAKLLRNWFVSNYGQTLYFL